MADMGHEEEKVIRDLLKTFGMRKVANEVANQALFLNRICKPIPDEWGNAMDSGDIQLFASNLQEGMY